MQKWEYKISEFVNSEVKLNALGRDGWELVTAAEGRLYFKRPLTGDVGWANKPPKRKIGPHVG